MNVSELSRRYARAAFELNSPQNEKFFEELRSMAEALSEDQGLREFLESSVVPGAEKIKILSSLSAKLSSSAANFFAVLSEKSRWGLFPEIVRAFQDLNDSSHSVTRGSVKSAVPLDLDQRKKIEATVEKSLGKRVILTFEEDKKIVGGMVAQVGGWTFDDSIESHLNRLNEKLKKQAGEPWKQ